jgi:nucleoside-diphosphate-sugar epimerase
VVDAVPALRNATPSLTRDRAREIWKDRWVVDAARFEKDSGWQATRTLEDALAEACAYYRRIRAL